MISATTAPESIGETKRRISSSTPAFKVVIRSLIHDSGSPATGESHCLRDCIVALEITMTMDAAWMHQRWRKYSILFSSTKFTGRGLGYADSARHSVRGASWRLAIDSAIGQESRRSRRDSGTLRRYHPFTGIPPSRPSRRTEQFS